MSFLSNFIAKLWMSSTLAVTKWNYLDDLLPASSTNGDGINARFYILNAYIVAACSRWPIRTIPIFIRLPWMTDLCSNNIEFRVIYLLILLWCCESQSVVATCDVDNSTDDCRYCTSKMKNFDVRSKLCFCSYQWQRAGVSLHTVCS